MTLSEAIRLGSMLLPQGFGSCFSYASTDSGERVKIASCAVGAAMDAGYSYNSLYGHVERLCPVATCIYFNRTRGTTLEMVIHLNDQHRWPRERIADWIEQQEQAGTITTLPEMVSV